MLASGMIGRGRLAALGRIVDATVEALSGRPRAAAAPAAPAAPSRNDLAGLHVVVTAGGTAEPIDPVRFVGNRSTGKMGIAVAEEALDRGAAVTLILGHVSVEPPGRCPRRPGRDRRRDAGGPAGPHPARRARASTSWSWPRPWPTSGRARRSDKQDRPRSDGLTTRDGRHAGPAGRDRRARARGHSSLGRRRPVLVGFAAETGSLRAGRREAPRPRAWTCSWPTTSASPVRASGRTPTGSRSTRPKRRPRSCRS